MSELQSSQFEFGSAGDQSFQVDADLLAANDRLADAIAFDGVSCVRHCIEVTLDRYKQAVPDLERRPEPLDAAIASVLLHLAAVHKPGEPAPADTLCQRHPHIRRAIQEAAAISSVIPDTGGFLESLRGQARILPADFGPPLYPGAPTARYELLSRLGGGAFGEVFLARDKVLSEEAHPALVAVKILRKQSCREQTLGLGSDEATQSRRINHANVVRVLDRGMGADGETYIVYEYIDGGTLWQFVRRRGGKLPVREAVALTIKIARGLQAAHSAGIIHCDIKPGNVLLTRSGEPKLSDFGIATSSDAPANLDNGDRPSAILGNLAFISPEQFRGEAGALTIATDVFALGGVLFWLVTGKLPNGNSVEQISRTHSLSAGRLSAPLPATEDPSIDRDLNKIVARALHPDRAERHQSSGEFAADLETWLQHMPIAWTAPGPYRQITLFCRRNPVMAGLVAAIVSLLLVLVPVVVTLISRTQSLGFERELTDATRRQLISARIQVQGLFGELIARKGKYRSQPPDAPVTPQEVREHLNFTQGVWTSSIGSADRLVPLVNNAGELDRMLTLVLRTETACWLVSLSGHMIAIPAIKSIQQEWQAELGRDDDFLVMLDCLGRCAEANALMDQLAVAPPSAEKDRVLDEAKDLQDQLRADIRSLDRIDRSGNFRILCLQKLTLLNGPAGLNNPRTAEYFAQEYARYVALYPVPGMEPIQLDQPRTLVPSRQPARSSAPKYPP